jgi:hypothetical protein
VAPPSLASRNFLARLGPLGTTHPRPTDTAGALGRCVEEIRVRMEAAHQHDVPPVAMHEPRQFVIPVMPIPYEYQAMLREPMDHHRHQLPHQLGRRGHRRPGRRDPKDVRHLVAGFAIRAAGDPLAGELPESREGSGMSLAMRWRGRLP